MTCLLPPVFQFNDLVMQNIKNIKVLQPWCMDIMKIVTKKQGKPKLTGCFEKHLISQYIQIYFWTKLKAGGHLSWI